jgi:hypothetical protein
VAKAARPTRTSARGAKRKTSRISRRRFKRELK